MPKILNTHTDRVLHVIPHIPGNGGLVLLARSLAVENYFAFYPSCEKRTQNTTDERRPFNSLPDVEEKVTPTQHA